MKQSFGKTVIALFAVSLAAVACSQPATADEPSTVPGTPADVPPGLANRIHEITDAVLIHHIDPPARQQMILSGIKGLYNAAALPFPPGLSRRVSALSTSEQLAVFLSDVWPKSTARPVLTEALVQAVEDGLLNCVSGGARIGLTQGAAKWPSRSQGTAMLAFRSPSIRTTRRSGRPSPRYSREALLIGRELRRMTSSSKSTRPIPRA